MGFGQESEDFDLASIRQLRHLSITCDGLDYVVDYALSDFARFLDIFKLPNTPMDRLELSVALMADYGGNRSVLQDLSHPHEWSPLNSALTRLCREDSPLYKALTVNYFVRGFDSQRLIQDNALTASAENMVKRSLPAFSGEIKFQFKAIS